LWAGAVAIGHFLWENRGLIVSTLAIVGCLIASFGTAGLAMLVCGVGAALGFLARASERIEHEGFQASLGANLIDLLFTASLFGMVGVPSILAEPAFVGLEGFAALGGLGIRALLLFGEAFPDAMWLFAEYGVLPSVSNFYGG